MRTATQGQRSVRRSTLAIGVVFTLVGTAIFTFAFIVPLISGDAGELRVWLCGAASLLFGGIGVACVYSFFRYPASAFTVADDARQRRAHFSIDDPRHDR